MMTSPSPATLQGEVESVERELREHERHDEKMYGQIHHHHHHPMGHAELKDCIEDVVEESIEDLEENVEKICEHINNPNLKGFNPMYTNTALPIAATSGGFGNDGFAAMMMAALLFDRDRFGRGGGGGYGNENVTTAILQNENTLGQFASINDRISAGNAALTSAIDHNSTLAAQARTDDRICGIEKDFFTANLAESERIAGLQHSIGEVRYDGALSELRTQNKIQETGCLQERLILDSRYENARVADHNRFAIDKELAEIKCLIKDTSKDERIHSLEKELLERSQQFQTTELLNSQRLQTLEVVGTIRNEINQALTAAGIAASV